ncbi:MAG: hypothetical protein R3C53_05250 [Pirellulaceae bacterium]
MALTAATTTSIRKVLCLCFLVGAATTATTVASASDGEPLAVRFWPGNVVSLETHWNLTARIDFQPNDPRTPRGLLLQMQRHYGEHTANVIKKFELADWPKE